MRAKHSAEYEASERQKRNEQLNEQTKLEIVRENYDEAEQNTGDKAKQTFKIRPTLKDIFLLQRAFYCQACEHFVEPTRPWRIVRNIFNTLAIMYALYTVFGELTGTMEGLAKTLIPLVIDLVVFIVVNYILLSMAETEQARASVDPEMQYYEEETYVEGFEEDYRANNRTGGNVGRFYEEDYSPAEEKDTYQNKN